jgi:hypothetical protein
LPGLELSAVDAREPPPIDVTLQCSEGLCVLAGIPIRIAARRVLLENVAVVGCRSAAIRMTASQEYELRNVVVVGNSATQYERATVELGAAGEADTAAALEHVVVGRNTCVDATLGLYPPPARGSTSCA